MNLRKNIVASLAAVALLTTGAELATQNTQPNTVEAATSNKKLTHNAAIYTSKGKRTKKTTLKKGKSIKILGTKTIKGKKYYRIGKNQYVKVSNFKKGAVKKTSAKKMSKEERLKSSPIIKIVAKKDASPLADGDTFLVRDYRSKTYNFNPGVICMDLEGMKKSYFNVLPASKVEKKYYKMVED